MEEFALSLLDTIGDVCETLPPEIFAIASIVLGLIIALLLAIILWPLNRIHIEDPFGDVLDRRSQ